MPKKFALLLALGCLASLVIVISTVPTPVTSLPLPPYSQPNKSTATKPSAAIRFKDRTLDWQIFPIHQQTSKQLTALTETLGAGICAFDANKDGWTDLFFIGGSGHTRHYGRESWWNKAGGNRFYLNQNGTYFLDVTERSGLKQNSWDMGCAVADFDNDGWQDLIITGVKSISLFKNTGGEQFINLTDNSGITAELWSTGASLGDFNNDGLIDLYISNYVRLEKGARTFERSKGFVTSNVEFDASLYDPLPNKLYVNRGNFKFEDVTGKAGVANTLGRSLGARWLHLNNDEWPDLLVINDAGTPNQVYLNKDGKSFSRAEKLFSAIETPGSRDIIVESIYSKEAHNLLITRESGLAPVLAKQAPPPGKYSDKAWDAGIADLYGLQNSSWGAVSGDFNNDGNSDLYIANGSSIPDIDSPFVTLGQHNQLYMGQSSGVFTQVVAPSPATQPLSSRSVISADLDNDGKLDLIVSNNNNPLTILQNTSINTGNWLGIDLQIHNSSAESSGANIKIIIAGEQLSFNAPPKHSFLSQSDSRIHLGIGSAQLIDELIIQWPDNTTSTFTSLEANHYYSIKKETNKLRKLPSPDKDTFKTTITNYDNSARVNLAEILLQLDTPTAFERFFALWKDSDKHAQLAILNSAVNSPPSKQLPFIKLALESESNSLKLAAIGRLKELEWEYSVNWLLPLLNDKSVEIRCAAAETFQLYFTEEEAVTHRKYLAVPRLAEMLTSKSAKTATCAANALAAAEKKRAVLPLIKLAQTHMDWKASAAAVRALGLVRDTSAVPTLIDIINNSENIHADVVAESLIALKRLNYKDINGLLINLASNIPQQSRSKKLKNHQIINQLLSNNDSVVFKEKQLKSLAKQLLQKGRLISPPVKDANLISAQLETIKLTHAKEQSAFAKGFISHNHESIRQQAYATLLSLSAQNEKFWKQLINNESPTSIIGVIHNAKPNSIGLSEPTVRILIEKFSGTKELTDLAVSLYAFNSSTSVAIFNQILDLSGSGDNYVNKLCENYGELAIQVLRHSKFDTQHNKLYLALNCLYQSNQITKLSSTEQLKYRLRVKQILESNQLSNNKKYELLINSAATERIIAKTMLVNNIDKIPDVLLEKALEALAKQKLTPEVSHYLTKLMLNPGKSIALRLAAAKQLIKINKQATLKFLLNRSLIDDIS